jgi:glutathione S-transferase
MILYGSQTSPFVRRLRLLLPEESYEFRKVDIFNPAERKELLKLSPLLKIPILVIDKQPIWDSRIIFNELVRRNFHRSLSLTEENLLTAMNDLSDSLIQTLLAKRSNISFPQDSPLAVSHFERIQNTLGYLHEQMELGHFKEWNFLSMALYTIVDWIDFRQLTKLDEFPLLIQFRDQNNHQTRVSLSDPRKT